MVDLLCVGSTCSGAGCHIDHLRGQTALVLNCDGCCGHFAWVESSNAWAAWKIKSNA